MSVLLPAVTALLALVFAIALFDQWRERRQPFQLVWAIGMLFFAAGSGAEALAAMGGWNEALYKTWYVGGAISTAAWLGLGTCYLLARTRFGYAVALSLFLAGVFTFLTARKPEYAGAGDAALLYFVVAAVLGAAVAIETYFQNTRWPHIAALAVVGTTIVGGAAVALATLTPPGYAVDPATGAATGAAIPPALRLLTPFMNITGSFALILGAIFSAYVYMPKRRVLAYSLDAGQSGDSFLFNLLIAPVAITVNFFASLPRAFGALIRGELHSRVLATILIAVGAIVTASGDTLARLGSTEFFQLGKLIGLVLIFAGFLVSIEAFNEIRVPFTSVVLRGHRHEPAGPAATAD
jgi:hypothetical protein